MKEVFDKKKEKKVFVVEIVLEKVQEENAWISVFDFDSWMDSDSDILEVQEVPGAPLGLPLQQ